MSQSLLKIVVLSAAAGSVACSGPPGAFPPQTEFGSSLITALSLERRESAHLKMRVEYPESFRGGVIDGVVTCDERGNTLTLVVHSLDLEGTHLCISGQIGAVANSKGTRARDDRGTPITVENFVPSTTTMVTQQVCTGQQEQQTCMPMIFPMSFPGTLSMLIKAEPNHGITLNRNSLLVLHLLNQPCN